MTDPNIDLLRTLGPYLYSLEPDPTRRAVLERLFKQDVDLLETKYNAAKDDKTRKEEFRRYQEAFAKGLPAFAAGVIGAVQGFQGGDSVAGSAAIMDVLASMATTIGAMAGPEGAAAGAVLGAFLSVVSMILKLFSDQKPAKSLANQIEEIIRSYDAEKKIQGLKAAQEGMEAFIDALEQGRDKRTHSEILETFAFHAGPAMQKILTAAEWLEEPKNQELELWSETLTAQCYAYITFVQSFGIALRVAARNVDVTDLVADLLSHHPHQVRFLEGIKPVARNRGTIWRIAAPSVATYYNRSSGPLSVRDAVHSKTGWKDMGGFMRSIAVTTRRMAAGGNSRSPRQPLAVFHLEPDEFRSADTTWQWESNLSRPFLRNARTFGLFGRWPEVGGGAYSQLEAGPGKDWKPLTGCYDVWATPGASAHEVYVYTANGDALAGYVQSAAEHSQDEDKRLRLLWSDPVPAGYKVGAVRCVTPKPFPDEDGSVLRDARVVYGACEVAKGMSQLNNGLHGYDHMEIRVLYFIPNQPLVRYNFNVPFWIRDGMDCVGISTDSRYLWIFGTGAIVCATHTSIKQGVERNSDPVWMHYAIPHEVGNYDPTTPYERSEVLSRGLLDLSACDDGTLTAVFCDNEPAWPHIYSLTPRIDRQAKRLIIEGVKEDSDGHLVPTNGWETDRDGATQRVIKQPIFCWSLIEGLIEALQLTAAPGVIHLGTDKSTEFVTVKNSSHAAMKVKVELGGDNPDDFTISNQCGESLAPGTPCRVSVEFKPKQLQAGKVSQAALWVESGASRATVMLYGDHGAVRTVTA